jgi:hypothetical protein
MWGIAILAERDTNACLMFEWFNIFLTSYIGLSVARRVAWQEHTSSLALTSFSQAERLSNDKDPSPEVGDPDTLSEDIALAISRFSSS